MVEKFAERSGLSGSSSIIQVSTTRLDYKVAESPRGADLRLASVNRVECLIQEQSKGPRIVHPRGAILVQSGSIPQQSQEVCDNETKARQSDQVWGHAHGEALDDEVCIEGLQNIFGEQGMVNAGVLVLAERGKLLLPDVNHRDSLSRSLSVTLLWWLCASVGL